MPDWSVLFTTDTPWLELVLRGTVVFFALLVLMRFVGQRESSGLGVSDLLVVVMVGAALGDSLTGGGDNIADGLVPVVTVMFWSMVMDALTYRWPRLTRLLKGRARPLILNGTLDRSALRREFISEDELGAQLRTHGLTEVSQVRRAYLEANGEISILPKDDADSGSTAPPSKQ